MSSEIRSLSDKLYQENGKSAVAIFQLYEEHAIILVATVVSTVVGHL